jgi:hypothetical protein
MDAVRASVAVANDGRPPVAPADTAQSAIAALMPATAPIDASLLASAGHANADTGPADAARPTPDLSTGLAGSSGGSGGGGFSPSFFLALLVALVGLARLQYERLRLPSFTWRPAVFVSLLERPG